MKSLTSQEWKALEKKKRRRSKYNVGEAEGRTWHGYVFHSRHEMEVYQGLLRAMAGQRRIVLRQVPFDLPGGVVFRLDFLVIKIPTTGPRIGCVHCIEAKGVRTQAYQIKRKQVEALYGIQIEEV